MDHEMDAKRSRSNSPAKEKLMIVETPPRKRRERFSRFETIKNIDKDERRTECGSNSSLIKVNSKNILVSNLPYEMTWQDVKDFLRQKIGVSDVYVELLKENGKSTGRCAIELTSVEIAQQAADVLHNLVIKGRTLRVKEYFFTLRATKTEAIDNRTANSYGMSPQFLEHLGINGQLMNAVAISNLDYKVSEEKLEEVFNMAGSVVDCLLKTEEDGKSSGKALVYFEHPVEAVQAISMFNGQMLFDRTMNVKMAKNSVVDELQKLPRGLKSVGFGLGFNGQPLRNVGRKLERSKTAGRPANGTSGFRLINQMLTVWDSNRFDSWGGLFEQQRCNSLQMGINNL